MCGIAGIIDYTKKDNKVEEVGKMLSAIRYRGPDESGIYHSPFATIGNVRLSIVDIFGGQQPLSDSSDRYWIVFNGEIFNYPELRNLLELKGCKFRTQSDTEVLVQLYAVYGSACLSMLNGQFAFAIWDKKSEELFIARDRVGIRPVFYHYTGKSFYFASEIKSLFTQERIIPEFRPESLSQVYTFWTTLTPHTAFKGVLELPPGHFMIYNRSTLKIQKYWELDFYSRNTSISFNDAKDQFNELFSNAVRIRLRADVEVAAYLSGGIDSSATVAYIKKIEPGILNTFSVRFEEKDFDESQYQTEAAKYFNTNHKSFLCSSDEIAKCFQNVIWHAEIPMTRTAPAPMYMLSRLVRENNIKVVITGEGSDEILAGYDIFKEAIIRNFWSRQPQSLLRPSLLKKIYPYIPQLSEANPKMLRMFYSYKLEDTQNPFYSHLLRWNNSNYIKKHLSPDFQNGLRDNQHEEELKGLLPENFNKWDLLAKSQWLETSIFMSGYLLSTQGDRMSMANSVEGRYPFLDYRVIEFCTSLPSDFKLKGLNEKYLLKKLLHDKIPSSILKRSKQAYRAPIRSAFLSENPPEYVKYMLSESQTKKVGVFNFKSLEPFLSKLTKTGLATEMDNMLLTAIISTHLVHFLFIEKQSTQFLPGNLSNCKIVHDL
jgi:asparagine synthase (glutamine-hydrolysing)